MRTFFCRSRRTAAGARISRIALALSVFWILCAGCRAPKYSVADVEKALTSKDYSSLEGQLVVRVLVVNLFMTTPSGGGTPFPAAGFTFEEGEVRASGQFSSLAGLEMPQRRLDRWVARLIREGSGGVLLATEFLVTPGRPNQAVDSRAIPYLQNWEFDKKGVATEVRKRLRPGAELTTCVSEMSDRDLFLVDFRLSKRVASLEKRRILGDENGPPGRNLQDLVLEMPREGMQQLATVVPIRRGHAVFLAHFSQQYQREAPGGESAMDVSRHVFYIVGVERAGRWLDLEVDRPTEPPPRRYALDLTWEIPLEGEDGGEAAQKPQVKEANGARLKLLEARQVSRLLLKRAERKSAVACALGMAVAEGASATFETADMSSYVAGITPEPGPGAEPPYRFDVRRAKAGILFKGALAAQKDSLRLSGHCRLADPYVVVVDSREMPSVRRPKDSFEKYRFERCVQELAEADFAAPASGDSIWQLYLPWREDVNGKSWKRLPAAYRPVYLGLSRIDQHERAKAVLGSEPAGQ